MAENIFVGLTEDTLLPVKCPSSFNWGLASVSDEDAGRVRQNAKMFVNKIADKVEIKLSWNATTGAETAEILHAFNHDYFFVKYHDPMTNDWTVKEFYHEDFSAPVYAWWQDDIRYQNVSFDIIER